MMHDSNGDLRPVHSNLTRERRRAGILAAAGDDPNRLAERVTALEDAVAVAQAAIAHCKGLAEAAAAAASAGMLHRQQPSPGARSLASPAPECPQLQHQEIPSLQHQEIPSLQQSNENAVITADTPASLAMPSPEPLAMGASRTPALPWQPLRMPPVQKEKTPTVPPEMLVPPAPPETSSRASAEAALHFDVKRFVELNDTELDHQASPRQQVLGMIAS